MYICDMKTKKRVKMIPLTEAQINELNDGLPHGSKKELANILGLSSAGVSMLMRPRFEYNKEKRRFVEVFRMNEEYYKMIVRFINSLKD